MALRSDLRASGPFEFVCRFVPRRSLYGWRPRPAPILRAKRRLQGPRPDPGPCDRNPVCRVSVGGKPLGMRVPLKFRHAHAFADGEARQSARSSPPWRLSSRSKESAFLTRQWRFCAKYQVNASLGERSRSRFPDEGGIGYRGGLRTARVYHPQCGRMPRQSATMPITARKDARSRPRSLSPTLRKMRTTFTGIKHHHMNTRALLGAPMKRPAEALHPYRSTSWFHRRKKERPRNPSG